MSFTPLERPPLVGIVLQETHPCPNCQKELFPSDTCLAVIKDVICPECKVLVYKIV